MRIFQILFVMAAGYLLGTVNPAYLIAKHRGFDIRKAGSGNAGASNAVITMGKKVGLFSAIFDIAKAYFAVKLAKRWFPKTPFASEIAGISVILGHIFPMSMGFRGGKGLACLTGVVLGFNGKVFLSLLVLEALLLLLTDYICVVPISLSIVFPPIYYLTTGSIVGAILYAALSPVIIWRHLENLHRIRTGLEARFSYLWRKDEEVSRFAQKWEESK